MGEIVIELKGNPSAQTLGSTEICQTAAHFSARTCLYGESVSVADRYYIDCPELGNHGFLYTFLFRFSRTFSYD